MTEPTIEQMMSAVRSSNLQYPYYDSIRAILEQHRNLRPVPIGALLALRENHKLEAIRAFVERVTKRWEVAGTPYASAVNEELAAMESDALTDELIAMERETNARTND